MKKIAWWLAVVISVVAFMPEAWAGEQEESKSPIPDVELTLLKAKRMGKGVIIPFRWLNNNSKDLTLFLDMNQGGGRDRAFLDNGESTWLQVTDNRPQLRTGVPLAGALWVEEVPADVEMINALFVVGRAPESPKVTDSNYYGDFTYTFKNIPIRNFPSTGTSGVVFTNSDFNVSNVKWRAVGGNLVIDYLITNTTGKDKSMRYRATDAVAYDEDGNKHNVTTKVSGNFPADVPVKATTTVVGGANKMFTLISLPFTDESVQWGNCALELKYFPR